VSVLETAPAPAPLVEARGVDAFVLPRVNLLPPELAEQARLRRLKTVLAGGLVATCGVVGALYLGAAADVADAAAGVSAATARTSDLQAQTRALDHVDQVYRQADEAKAQLAAAMGEEVRFSQFLDDLSKDVPEHVWLTDITFTQTTAAGEQAAATPTAAGGIGTVTFTGVGFRHDDVAAWLDSLAAQEGFADPYVTDSTAGRIGERRTVSFTSSVTLTADALSGRYTAQEGS
jgi:Tfp pilus assembly protein PilN